MKQWIVYQSQGPANTVGMEIARSWSQGMAQKIADRANEYAIKNRTTDRYSVRQETK